MSKKPRQIIKGMGFSFVALIYVADVTKYAKPPLKSQIVQAALYRQSLPIYWLVVTTS